MRLGILPPLISPYVIRRPGRSRRVLAGERMDAVTALRYGLVQGAFLEKRKPKWTQEA